MPTPAPAYLLPPEVLHRTKELTVWHTGLVDGPYGPTVSVVVDRAEGSRLDLTGEPWHLPMDDGIPPVGAMLRLPGSPAGLLGLPDSYGSFEYLRATCEFGRVDARDSFLTFFVQPLGLRTTVYLSPDAPPPPPDDSVPCAVADPEILYDADGCLVWHSGAVQGPYGIEAMIQVRTDPGRPDVELLGCRRWGWTWSGRWREGGPGAGSRGGRRSGPGPPVSVRQATRSARESFCAGTVTGSADSVARAQHVRASRASADASAASIVFVEVVTHSVYVTSSSACLDSGVGFWAWASRFSA
ncbi:hypothetical protein GCM10010329_34260 [Streptomyces spiroverticillatus]|uniref:Uncharacterized protein n=1 Tax=Streptomyces finlayi TaxID=67296 RepID=A0A918WX41_9ACTN|nr:hypothetical protein GCM10010329_34260 [Streptomyces spiroverticillatus]GHC91543.1 hypothetical protein GCM10010334_26670 [Streptomyces finlayi]